MIPNESVPNPPSPRRARGSGCGSVAGIILVAIMAVFVTFMAQLLSWGAEQAIFQEPIHIPDTRWVIALAYAFTLILFTSPLVYSTPPSRARSIFRTWLLAAIAALLLVPARLPWITDATDIELLQIAGLIVFLIVARIWLRTGFRPGPQTGGVGWALFWALCIALPFVMWGALGSPLDIVLNLIVGLLLGFSASLLLNASLLASEVEDGSDHFWSNGLVFGLALMILATGLGVMGEQWMLLAVLLPLSWAAVGLATYARRGALGSSLIPPALLLGFSAAWPMTWIDPDELSLVISDGPGELIQWANRMVFLAAAIAVFASLVIYFTRRRWSETARPSRLGLILPLAALVGLGIVYVAVGQVGFYGERLFVVLKDQADVSSAVQMKDYNQRRVFVYQTLVSHAVQTQAGLRAQLSQFGIQSKPYYLVNAVEVWGGPVLRLWLQNRPEVDRILDNPELRPLPAAVPESIGHVPKPSTPMWNQTMIGADRVWRDLGVTGKGVLVGQSDSGVQGDHPELSATYRGQGGQNDYNWYDPWNGSQSPTDIGGHGTHTLGSILGKNVGIAPGAQWIGCVNLARNLGNPSVYLDCWQFMLAPFPQNGDPFKDGDPTKGAMVLNNSWGCPRVEGCDWKTYLPAVKALRDAGIFVVVSAGNSGDVGCGTVEDPPAIYGEVYSVGAVDEQGLRASFSSMGPVEVDGSNRLKPDIGAPGQGVLSSYPGSTYYVASGTSMAGPHLVGTVALMWSANPGLVGNIELTTKLLNQTARQYRGQLPECASGQGSPNDVVGYGIVDAYEAVKAAQASH